MSDAAKGASTVGPAAITELSEVTVTHIAARRGTGEALGVAARATFGADFPTSPRVTSTGGTMVVWAGPEQWLIVQPRQGDGDVSAQLAKTFNGLASVVDVSDSRTIFRLAGSHPSDALVRSLGIDFADDVFRPGDVAITHAAHLGVMIWRLPDGSGYDFACARTYSRDFLDWLHKV